MDPPQGPLERWKLPLLGLFCVLGVVGGAYWIAGQPAGPPIAVPTPGGERSSHPIVIDVAGAVARPGVYTLGEGARVRDAIEQAGGMTEAADRDRVNLALRVRDQQQVVVPTLATPAPAAATASKPSRATPVLTGRVNLNTASQAQLEALPGIGEVTAQKILRHREQNGPFASLDDFHNARLVNNATWEKIKDLVEAP